MTQDEARKYFDYDAETGALTWRVSLSNRALAGAKAGSQNGRGYLTIQVNRKPYYVHRIIWLLVHGYFPEHQIDHINRDRADNRLENLREVTSQCNNRNAGQRADNTSGVTGVVWHKQRGKWRAQITVNSRNHSLGRYTDLTEAVKARHAAEIQYNYPGCNSHSDAYQYLKEMDYGQ